MREISGFFIILPGGAWAHVGHLGSVAGHDHWVAGAAIGAAAALTIWGLLKGKRDADRANAPDDADAEPEAEAEEQPA